MSTLSVNAALLRPAIIHILRASGFHSTRASVLDTLTDIAARYLLFISSKTAERVYDRTRAAGLDEATNEIELDEELEESANALPIPILADVRLALDSASLFTPTMTPSEEAWCEILRCPLSAFPDGAREKERIRRDLEDTRDVRSLTEWAEGPVNREIRRIAGLLPESSEDRGLTVLPSVDAAPAPTAAEGTESKDDYLAVLKKKHSRTGDSARFAGTILGKSGDGRAPLSIDGGPPTFSSWENSTKRKTLENLQKESQTLKRQKIG